MIHRDLKITESLAIMRYVANKFAPAEFTGKGAHDKAIVDMVLSTLADIKLAATTHCYLSGDLEACKAIGFDRLSEVSNFLGDKKFFVGDYFTFADFFVFEQIEHFTFLTDGEILARYPNLGEFHKRVTQLPRFGEYYPSDKFMKRPFHSKFAKINN